MLRLPHFEFRFAPSVSEAARILAGEGPRARLVAGGTDLWPNMKRRHQKAEVVISLMRIPELRGIEAGNGSEELRLGSTSILDEIAGSELVGRRYPALARAVASISSPPLRNMATLGGNLCVDTRCTYYNQTEEWRRSIDFCMKEEGSICWVAPSSPRCWAHSASDSAPMLCALKAQVKLVSHEGERLIPVEALYQDDGIDYLTKRPEEIVTDVFLAGRSDSSSCRSSFWKLRRRGTIDFAVLSAAVAVWTDSDGRVEEARIFLGAVGSSPRPVTGAMEFLQGKPLGAETIAEAAGFARRTAVPMDNTDFQAQWRGLMAVKYTEAALRQAAGLDPGLLPPNHSGS